MLCLYMNSLTDELFLVFVVGSFCNCILPEALKTSTVKHDSNFQESDSEKKRLRTAFSCLSSISMPQMEVPMCSLFLHSHYKGCLPPWQLKKSKKGSLKQKWKEGIIVFSQFSVNSYFDSPRCFYSFLSYLLSSFFLVIFVWFWISVRYIAVDVFFLRNGSSRGEIKKQNKLQSWFIQQRVHSFMNERNWLIWSFLCLITWW